MILRTHSEIGMECTAHFSDCEKYRYVLTREWDASKPTLVFIMLNPSTADERIVDPTVHRCITRAKAGGYGCLVVLNIFALRSTDPKALYSVTDPIGQDNNRHIFQYTENDVDIICAWGEHGEFMQRGEWIMECLRKKNLFYLRRNKSGAPAHPLYIPLSQKPIRWGWQGDST